VSGNVAGAVSNRGGGGGSSSPGPSLVRLHHEVGIQPIGGDRKLLALENLHVVIERGEIDDRRRRHLGLSGRRAGAGERRV